MVGQMITDGNFQGIGNDGLVVPYGKLYIKDHATGRNITTYQDSNLTITNTSPVILSPSGKAKVFIPYGVVDITLNDQFDTTIWVNNNFVLSVMDTQTALDAAYNTSINATKADNSAIVATTQANAAITASNSSQVSAIITNAYANINWAGFRYVDGELLVDYFNTTTSTPSLVNGELILTW